MFFRIVSLTVCADVKHQDDYMGLTVPETACIHTSNLIMHIFQYHKHLATAIIYA
jgi:hypothetical protein